MSTIIRIRSRDGLERVSIEDTGNTTVGQFMFAIESQLRVPRQEQLLSTNQNLLLARTPDNFTWFTDMSDHNTLLSSLSIEHGSVVFLAYNSERTIAGPAFTPAGAFGKKMTIEDLVAKQMTVTSRQENPHCDPLSMDPDAIDAYVNETLVSAVKRVEIDETKKKKRKQEESEEEHKSAAQRTTNCPSSTENSADYVNHAHWIKRTRREFCASAPATLEQKSSLCKC